VVPVASDQLSLACQVLGRGGAILFTARTGAYSVHGEILRHYLKLGGPASVLGYPTSDELATRQTGPGASTPSPAVSCCGSPG